MQEPVSISKPGKQQPAAASKKTNAQTLSIQTKLNIGSVDDPLEHEADDVADKIMRMPEASFIQRKCAHCEEEEKTIHRKPLAHFIQKKSIDNTEQTSDSLASRIDSSRNNGSAMDVQSRSFMESRFGTEFSRVKIHTGSEAVQMSRELNAQAFTTGNDIYFNEGKYDPFSSNGKFLLAHELTHVLQQHTGSVHRKPFIQRQPIVATPPTQTQLNQLCYSTGTPQPTRSARQPELHPTYERWIHSFTGMATFRSNDTITGGVAGSTFDVLGTGARRFGTRGTSETATATGITAAANGEEFIDHPTNDWVMNCLPPNLRVTAYQLPADCADIAIILRHVWLSAHRRTETYRGFTVGDLAGNANPTRALSLIRSVFSGNVDAMVSPYSDATGNAITNINRLAPMLHPGDILVWEHRERVGTGANISARRTGGHTQTITNIVRSGGTITAINVIQGNQPIFPDAATDILTSRGVSPADPNSTEGRRLRDLPGRRIEADQAVSILNITDPVSQNLVWGEDHPPSFTVLVAAGPARAASRPRATAAARNIMDWTGAIRTANTNTITGVLESLLQEARSLIEGGIGTAPTSGNMEALGRLIGERLRELNANNIDNLIRVRNSMSAIILALRDDANNLLAVRPLLNDFNSGFNTSAVPTGITLENRRLFTENTVIAPFLVPFASEITSLASRLRQANNITQARTAVSQAGLSLWQASTTRAQTGAHPDADDRPLYWTRIRMLEEIRNFNSRFRIRPAQRQQLADAFESSSRGRTSVDFSAATSTQKKILISGFDPFGFNQALGSSGSINQTILDANPSGSAVLALDGTTVSGAGGLSGYIQGTIFPVRFADFDQGMIEQLFTPFLNGTQPVNMIMTISQGWQHFDIERWAGRRRSDAVADNSLVMSGGTPATPIVPPGLTAGAEFLETQLPHGAMSRVPGTRLNQARSTGPGGIAIAGSGGGFLSNEIFYRVRLLQTNMGGTMVNLPVGHLHIPTEDQMAVDVIVSRVRQIIAAALPGI